MFFFIVCMEFSIISIYQYIYIFFVAIITFAYVGKYRTNPLLLQSNIMAELFLVFVFALFIGLRPVNSVFFDMTTYLYNLQKIQGTTFDFTFETDNIFFDNLFTWWGCNGISPTLFFLAIATIYMGCSYVGIKRLFGCHAMLAYLVFLAAFSTFSYGTNGIKAGAAASIFIMALSYWNKLWICIPLMIVSLGFHHSMIAPIAAFVVAYVLKNPKWFYYVWFVCFLMSAFHVTYFQFLFGGMADEQGAGYLMATEATSKAHIGFRLDFVLYSAVPVWIGYQLEMKKNMKLSNTYHTLMHFYLATNAIWMLCMYASFNNRIAYLSWFVYPIVIIFPFLDDKNTDPQRFIKLRKTVLYHLYFTMFMVFVYYGIFSLGH